MARETVAVDTPAASATSLIVMAMTGQCMAVGGGVHNRLHTNVTYGSRINTSKRANDAIEEVRLARGDRSEPEDRHGLA